MWGFITICVWGYMYMGTRPRFDHGTRSWPSSHPWRTRAHDHRDFPAKHATQVQRSIKIIYCQSDKMCDFDSHLIRWPSKMFLLTFIASTILSSLFYSITKGLVDSFLIFLILGNAGLDRIKRHSEPAREWKRVWKKAVWKLFYNRDTIGDAQQ